MPPLTPIPPHQQETILHLLASPQFSLADIAGIHSISIHDLCAWLTEPAVRERLRTLEETAAAHTRLVATLNLPKAGRAVTAIIDEYANEAARDASRSNRANTSTANVNDPTRVSRLQLRRAQIAQRASWLLLRLARLTPVSDADLQRARDTIPASAASNRTASANERISSSDSSRVACLLEEQACSESESAKRTSSSHRTANVSERTSPDADSRATGCAVGGPTSANNTSRERISAPSRTANVSERVSSSDVGLTERLSSDSDSHATGCLSAEASSLDPPSPVPRHLQTA